MDNDFSHIETLENAVKWHYFRNDLSWPIDKTAYEMNVNERRLIEWVNARASVITGLLKSDPGKVDAIREKLKEQHAPPQLEESPEVLKLDPVKVGREYMKGELSLYDLAVKFKCDYNKFRVWWNRNLSVINAQMKRE